MVTFPEPRFILLTMIFCSKIEGTFWDRDHERSFTCWNKKLSFKHSKKSVEI